MLNRRALTLKYAATIVILCARLSGQIVSTRCDSGELSKDATPATTLTYLSQDRLNLNSACISIAIDILRAKKPIPAVPVLIKYLDFGIPVPQVLRHTHEATDGLYPAADALARFGNTAVPALEEAVGNDDLSAIGRSNAAKELLVEATDQVHVVKLTRKAAQSPRDYEAADALRKLANLMASYCQPDVKQQCKEAANEN
jgi:hypothetical protein